MFCFLKVLFKEQYLITGEMTVFGHYLDHLTVLSSVITSKCNQMQKVFADVLLKTLISHLKIYPEMFLV